MSGYRGRVLPPRRVVVGKDDDVPVAKVSGPRGVEMAAAAATRVAGGDEPPALERRHVFFAFRNEDRVGGEDLWQAVGHARTCAEPVLSAIEIQLV